MEVIAWVVVPSTGYVGLRNGMIKGTSRIFKMHTMNTYMGGEVQRHSFLASDLDGGELVNSTTRPIHPREKPTVRIE